MKTLHNENSKMKNFGANVFQKERNNVLSINKLINYQINK